MSEETEKITDLRSYKVVKDNQIIQNVRKEKYTLSVLEQKALLYIISMIKPPKEDSNGVIDAPVYEYEFEIAKFCKICGINNRSGKNYENIRTALKNISDSSFWLRSGDGRQMLFRWFSSATIIEGEGKITIEISPNVMPYLFNLSDNFTTYELYYVLALSSTHSITLYELLKSYSFKKNIALTLEELRDNMMLGTKYPLFKDFRRYVLDVAVKEINGYTDINVYWNPIKTGRSVTAIEFNIEMKNSMDRAVTRTKVLEELS